MIKSLLFDIYFFLPEGFFSFEAFSHRRSILRRGDHMVSDAPFRSRIFHVASFLHCIPSVMMSLYDFLSFCIFNSISHDTFLLCWSLYLTFSTVLFFRRYPPYSAFNLSLFQYAAALPDLPSITGTTFSLGLLGAIVVAIVTNYRSTLLTLLSKYL